MQIMYSKISKEENIYHLEHNWYKYFVSVLVSTDIHTTSKQLVSEKSGIGAPIQNFSGEHTLSELICSTTDMLDTFQKTCLTVFLS